MKLINHRMKRQFLYVLTSCVALLFSLPLVAQQVKSRNETQSTFRWEHRDDGLRRRFEARGKPEFTDDYSDIKSISEGGWVIVDGERNGQTLRYEVRRDAAGNLTRSLFVNGAARQLDDSTRAWLAKFMLDVVRQGGFDAEKRVHTILTQKGVAGVLAEIDQISGDYAKRIYYEQLMKQANLNAAGLRDVLRQMAHNITSDYEQSQLLIAVAPMLTGKDAAIQPFFEAVGTIQSDYEHSRVLKTMLKQGAPESNDELLRRLLASAEGISSDYEKATFLIEASNVYARNTRLRSEFLKAVESIKSDYERGRVLSALLKNKQIG